ncbi:MAG: NCS2 family permease [Acidimicrobiia bacterium]|nr:NCS2 family permease [Acidimicrobiia bacterium]
MRSRLERYFQFQELNTNWRTEILAGATTFATMAYIVFVNPAILGEAGMPVTAVMAATCASAALASILMGAFARYPIALAPGMGINAYFAYTVVIGMGIPWQTALGAVFLSGVAFLVLTVAGIRERIFASIPAVLYSSVAVGIGLFIAFIGFRNSGLIVPDKATTVKLGNLSDPHALLSIFGLIVTAALLSRGLSSAMLSGIVLTTAAGAVFGLVPFQMKPYRFTEITATAFQLDIPAALRLGLLEIVFVFLFVDFFDNLGTLVAVGKKAQLFDSAGNIPRLNRILVTDAAATIAGSFAGTSTVVSYIESAAGTVAGGRSGVTAIVAGLFFVGALFLAPLAGAIPAAATAPALILVGAAMVSHAAEIDWAKPSLAIPAFLTITTIPLTFSIANGIAIGFTAYTLVNLLSGNWRRIHWMLWVLTALFVVRFAYLGQV